MNARILLGMDGCNVKTHFYSFGHDVVGYELIKVYYDSLEN